MSIPLSFQGKPLELLLSRGAAWELQHQQQQAKQLYVRMELLFSCLVKKNLMFHFAAPVDLPCEEVAPGLFLGFQAMINRSCDLGDGPQLVEYPAAACYKKTQPKWLLLEFHQGAFVGEFGLRLAEAPRPSRYPGRLTLALVVPQPR